MTLLEPNDAATAAIAAPIVTGLVEAAKRAGLPAQYAGAAAVVLAVPVVVLLSGQADLEALITAIVAGLTAAGLYSQAKTLASSKPAAPAAESE